MNTKNQKAELSRQHDLIPVGLVKFQPAFQNYLLQQFKKKYQKILSQKQWDIQEDYQKTQWPSIIRMMNVAEVEVITFGYVNLNQKFLVDISPIRMENLKDLYLCDNKISNIQSLTYLYAPNLQSISLVDNKITNITKTISKFNFKRLQAINITNNFVRQADMGRVYSLAQKGFMIQYQDNFSGMLGQCSINDHSGYAKTYNLDGKLFQIFTINFASKFDPFHGQVYKPTQIYQQKCSNAILRKANSKKKLPNPFEQM